MRWGQQARESSMSPGKDQKIGHRRGRANTNTPQGLHKVPVVMAALLRKGRTWQWYRGHLGQGRGVHRQLGGLQGRACRACAASWVAPPFALCGTPLLSGCCPSQFPPCETGCTLASVLQAGRASPLPSHILPLLPLPALMGWGHNQTSQP